MADETWYYVDGDGTTFQIAFTSSRVLLGTTSAGFPPIEHYTQTAPSEDGALHLGYKCKPRYFTIRFLDIAGDRSTLVAT